MAQQRLIGTSTSQVPTNGMLGTLAFMNAANAAFPAPVNISLGSAAAPSIAFTGDINTGIYSPGADQVGISTGGTSRFEVSTTAATSTLPVVHPLGAVGTPSITFTGDLNTGIYSPGADQVGISTGGTNRLFVSSSGSVGIGTTSPGTSRTYIQAADTNTAGLTINGINSSGGVSGYSSLKITGNTPNAVGTHYGVEFVKTASNVESITGYYADITGAYNTQTNFYAKLTKDLGAFTNGYCYYANLATSSSGGTAYFAYFYNSTSSAERFSITSAGTTTLISEASTAPFIAKIGSSEVSRIDSSGRLLVGTSAANTSGAKLQTVDGITFPATQVASADPNTLDDYEEGTWTPSQGAGLTVVGAYSSSGFYTKIGKVVHVFAALKGATSIASSTGGILCGGLPFTPVPPLSGFVVGSMMNHAQTQSNTCSAIGSANVYGTVAVSANVGIYFAMTYYV